MSFAYLPLFTGDYLRDTRHLTPLRHGVFLLSLMHCWDSKGPMPLDEQECAGICNCRSADEIEAMRYVLSRYFVQLPDGHYNKRMADEVAKSDALSKTFRDAGIKSGEIRRARGAVRKAKRESFEPTLNLALTKAEGRSVSPSPSPSPSLHHPHPQNGGDPPNPPSATRSPAGKRPALGAETWGNYARAYSAKYGVEPVRNRKVNAQVAQLVERLGEAEAPFVAEYYLTHRHSLYVSAKHCIDLLLRDAEKLRTEWATGTQGTHTQAVMTDKTQTNYNSFAPLIAAARQKEAEEARNAEK